LAAIADLKAGKPIFVGPLKDNKGNVVIEKTLGLYDGVLWQTNYLLDGIVGSVT
jgi:basic membrane protein A